MTESPPDYVALFIQAAMSKIEATEARVAEILSDQAVEVVRREQLEHELAELHDWFEERKPKLEALLEERKDSRASRRKILEWVLIAALGFLASRLPALLDWLRALPTE